MTKQDHATDVLVAGAGPVGLTLAMDLAARGVRVTMLETRRFGEPPSVKCNHVSARSMEVYRRLGVAQALRDAGLPADYPNDIAFRTSVTGREIARIPIPCRRDRYTATGGPDTWWPTTEPPHRINQLYMEPILLRHAVERHGLQLLSRTQLMAFEQDGEGVRVTAKDLETGKDSVLHARFLVGCDGGASTVRKQMGASFEGTPVIQRVQSTYLRAPGLRERMQQPSAWCYYSVNPRRCGTVFSIDGADNWLVHNHLNADEPEFDSVDRDWAIRQILGVDDDFRWEVISREDWVGRRLVADRFRNGNVFIAGDAAHLWVPYAGYGMNAGIADAANLAWLLAARVQGWGAQGILDAYEAERQPITQQVSNFAMDHAAKMMKARRAVPANIEGDDADAQRAREETGREAYDLNVQQFCCAGLNFGYFYAGSPIIVADGEEPPPYTMGSFTESSVPGCRAPQLALQDGTSLFDALGPGYTLLRFGDSPVAALEEEAARRGMPFKTLDLRGVARPPAYRHALAIVRCDQHVAWRGDAVPQDVAGLIDVLRGAHGNG
jgi:2-polyprenyl-6-methoxyphenol hydroxylase-like FAD-dependent oxidoreductase